LKDCFRAKGLTKYSEADARLVFLVQKTKSYTIITIFFNQKQYYNHNCHFSAHIRRLNYDVLASHGCQGYNLNSTNGTKALFFTFKISGNIIEKLNGDSFY